tara:strand:+ start:494 stop:811 length:318 start_codon:yes stop_codon:yes gene_type:complete
MNIRDIIREQLASARHLMERLERFEQEGFTSLEPCEEHQWGDPHLHRRMDDTLALVQECKVCGMCLFTELERVSEDTHDPWQELRAPSSVLYKAASDTEDNQEEE